MDMYLGEKVGEIQGEFSHIIITLARYKISIKMLILLILLARLRDKTKISFYSSFTNDMLLHCQGLVRHSVEILDQCGQKLFSADADLSKFARTDLLLNCNTL